MVLLISAISFIFVLAVGFIVFTRSGSQSPLDRLEDYEPEVVIKASKPMEEGPIKKLARLLPNVDQFFSKLKRNLVYSDSKYSVEEIITIKGMSSGAIAFLAFAVTKNALLASLVLIGIWFVPDWIIASRAKKRMTEFNEQLADGMLVICNALKAGYSFMQAVSLVSREMDGPLAKEFGITFKEMSFGIPMEDSFGSLVQRVDSEDLKLVVNAILIQKDVGGNLAEILDKIIDTIRERQRIKAEVKTLTAQGRLSGVIIALLPFVMAAFLFVVNRDYLMMLFQSPVGIGMVAYGLCSQLIGFLVIRKMTDIEL